VGKYIAEIEKICKIVSFLNEIQKQDFKIINKNRIQNESRKI